MNVFSYILAGVVAGIIIGLVIKNKKTIMTQSCCAPQTDHTDDEQGIVKEQAQEKEKNLQKIRQYIADKEKVTNEEIQKLLNISNATVARYFNELQEEGLVKQVGDTGQNVYYDVIR